MDAFIDSFGALAQQKNKKVQLDIGDYKEP